MNPQDLEEVIRLDECLLEKNFQELYDQAPCGYLSTLADGTFVRANETFCKWTGYTQSELVGARRIQDLLTIPCRIYYETHLAPLLQMQGKVDQIALDLQTKEGRILHAFINTVQAGATETSASLFRTTVFNASERRNYERELLAARRNAENLAQSKSRLLSMVSHEMRSPLQAIDMVAEILQRSQDPQSLERSVKILKSSAQSLLQFANQLLEYGRLDSGSVTLHPVPFKLEDVMEHVQVTFQSAAEKKGVRLQMTKNFPPGKVYLADEARLRQVLANLVGNAVKFTERGHVELRGELLGKPSGFPALHFAVADTGIGIPRDRIERIFEEFAQAGPEISSKYGGSGLGLWISKKILSLMGSDLRVESVPGEGSCFSFTVQVTEPGSPSPGSGAA